MQGIPPPALPPASSQAGNLFKSQFSSRAGVAQARRNLRGRQNRHVSTDGSLIPKGRNVEAASFYLHQNISFLFFREPSEAPYASIWPSERESLAVLFPFNLFSLAKNICSL